MDANRVVQMLEGKTILITGATGFLAKVLLEKILRVQPNIKRIYLLIRDSSDRSAAQRLHHEILGTELFRVLREELGGSIASFLSSKVIPIAGDVSEKNLGIKSEELIDEIRAELDFIINSAATTRFDERYDIAMNINAFGAMNVLEFAKRCAKFKLLLHVSTAYVHGTREGLLHEEPIQMGATLEGANISYLDIESEKHLVENTKLQLQAQNMDEKELTSILKNLGIKRANLHGWPNTYSFTKVMGEMLLGHFKENIPIVIVRPTIVTSTYKEPFPGWMEGVRTLDCFTVAYGKQTLPMFVGDGEAILDLIPGDMVVNTMLATMAINGVESRSSRGVRIYQVGSSRRNPIKQKEVEWFMFKYFKKHPLLDSKSRPIIVRKPVALSMANFQRFITIQSLFWKVLELLNVMLCNIFESLCIRLRWRINQVVRMIELYKPYFFFRGIFDDVNTECLEREMREMDASTKMFDFDPRSINWEDYFINAHFPGIIKYVLK